MVQIPRVDPQVSIEPTRPRTEETGPFKDSSLDIVGKAIRNVADQYNQIRDQKEVNEATSILTEGVTAASDAAENDPDPSTAYERYAASVDEAVAASTSNITNPLNRARYQGQAQKVGIVTKQKIKNTANTRLVNMERVDIQDKNEADLERFHQETDPYLKSQIKGIMLGRLNQAELNLTYNPVEAKKFRDALNEATTIGQINYDIGIDAASVVKRLYNKDENGEYTDYRFLNESERGALEVRAAGFMPAQEKAAQIGYMLINGSENQKHLKGILERKYDVNDLLEQGVRAAAKDPTAMSPGLIKAGLALLKNEKAVGNKSKARDYIHLTDVMDEFAKVLESGSVDLAGELGTINEIRELIANGAAKAGLDTKDSRELLSTFDIFYDKGVEDAALKNYKARMVDVALGNKMADELVENLSGGIMKKIAIASMGVSAGVGGVSPFMALGGTKFLTELVANKVIPREIVEKIAFAADDEAKQLTMNLRKEIRLRVQYNGERLQDVADEISAREKAKINPNNVIYKLGEKTLAPNGQFVLTVGYDKDGEPIVEDDF